MRNNFPSLTHESSSSSTSMILHGNVPRRWEDDTEDLALNETAIENSTRRSDPNMLSVKSVVQTWRGSLSAWTKPMFARKYASESALRDLLDYIRWHPFAVLRSEMFSMSLCSSFSRSCKNWKWSSKRLHACTVIIAMFAHLGEMFLHFQRYSRKC